MSCWSPRCPGAALQQVQSGSFVAVLQAGPAHRRIELRIVGIAPQRRRKNLQCHIRPLQLQIHPGQHLARLDAIKLPHVPPPRELDLRSTSPPAQPGAAQQQSRRHDIRQRRNDLRFGHGSDVISSLVKASRADSKRVTGRTLDQFRLSDTGSGHISRRELGIDQIDQQAAVFGYRQLAGLPLRAAANAVIAAL